MKMVFKFLINLVLLIGAIRECMNSINTQIQMSTKILVTYIKKKELWSTSHRMINTNSVQNLKSWVRATERNPRKKSNTIISKAVCHILRECLKT